MSGRSAQTGSSPLTSSHGIRPVARIVSICSSNCSIFPGRTSGTSLRAARCPMTRPCWSRRDLFVTGRDQRPAVRTRERPGASRRRKSPAIGADDEPGAWRYRLRLLRRSVTFLQPLRPATRINLSASLWVSSLNIARPRESGAFFLRDTGRRLLFQQTHRPMTRESDQ
jgi:hypothetical protein